MFESAAISSIDKSSSSSAATSASSSASSESKRATAGLNIDPSLVCRSSGSGGATAAPAFGCCALMAKETEEDEAENLSRILACRV